MTSETLPMPVAAAGAVSLRPTMPVPALVAAAGERASMRFLESRILHVLAEGRALTPQECPGLDARPGEAALRAIGEAWPP